MKYISTYESFSVNETMDMFTLPVDPIPGIKDVISDIGEWFTQTGEFLWNKLTSFIDWLKSKISIPGIKEYFSQLFEAIGELSKIQLNRVTNLFFDKEYTKVEWSDLNVGTVKNLYQKITTSIKEFTTDKSLKLKYWINTTLAFLGKSVLSAVIHAILSTILIALGLSAGPIVATIASVVILILFIWASKKKVNLDIKVMKDVRDVPGYKPQSIIGKITGWSDFAKQKVEDYQDFTQGESQFQKLYFQRLKEQKEKIKSEELNFS